MWCGSRINSDDLEIDEKLVVVNGSSENKLKSLFQKPQRKRSRNLFDYCKTRCGQSILDRGNKLLDLIRTTIKWPQSNVEKQPNKHVMFADSLGLDLELIHTIQINSQQTNDELDKLITKQSFFKSYNRRLNNDSSNNSVTSTTSTTTALTFAAKFNNRRHSQSQSDVLIIPKFAISPDRNYDKLITSGICLNSIEIYNQSSIRGVILTLTKPAESSYIEYGIDSRSLLENSSSGGIYEIESSRKPHVVEMSGIDDTKSITSSSNSISKLSTSSWSKKSKQSSSNHQLDIVYIIWTVDEWKSWKYQAAIKNNCRTLPPNKGIIKTYEFFLQNLDTKLQVGQTLELIICHQIDLVVYKDTNNEECYKFEFAVKI